MIATGRTQDGAEEWACPTCGRRMLLRWPPHYSKVVLEHGDDSVMHVGGKSGLQVGTAAVTPAQPGQVQAADRRWLREVGIDWDDTSS